MSASLRTPMERAPVPDLGTGLIPKERYTCPEFARREREGMWTRVWLLAGRESDAALPGDYFTFEIGPESILVIRQRDGSLGARHNVCMHRGNRLREPGRGHAELFSCMFHGWKYDLDGTLLEALDPECFPQGLPRPALDLAPVRCDTWGGFVWVNLDPHAGSLRDYLGVIPEHLGPYHFEEWKNFEEWKIAYDASIEIDCNWKTSVDAFHYTVFPNVTLNIHSLFTWVFTHRPHPEDPNKMFFDFLSLLRTPAQDVPRPAREHYRTADGDTMEGRCEGGELLDEDLYNLPRIQSGMRSAGFRGLHLSTQEIRIRHFHDTLMRYLEGASRG